MPNDLLQLGVKEIQALYRRRKLSPVEVTQACLKQVDKYNPLLNAICHMDAREALKQARASEARFMIGTARGALDGIPATIKDWYNIKGWPTRQGSKISAASAQKEDSVAVQLLRDAGCVFIGKTTLPEFGHKGVCHGPLHGVSRNPWDPDKTCGGSSGGAAIAAATGMAWLNLGSDAGGSVRIPASFSGVFGFKPSPGVMPSWPPSLFSSLSSIGPLTRSVADAADMLDVLDVRLPQDFNAAPVDKMNFAAQLKKPLRKLRIAVAEQVEGIGMVAEARAVWQKKKAALGVLGQVEEIKLDVSGLAETFAGHWTAVASLIASNFTPAQKKLADPRFMHWVARGDKQHLHSYLGAEYQRMLIGSYFKKLFGDYDLLVTPTTPFPAFDCGIDYPTIKGKAWLDWNIFNAFANLAKLPAASLPIGLSAQGLPVGMQLCGGYLQDATVLRAAAKLEDELAFTPWLARA